MVIEVDVEVEARPLGEEPEEAPEQAGRGVRLVSVIFLPFQRVFGAVVLSAVLAKCLLSPTLALYPVLLCSTTLALPLHYAISFYSYFANYIFGVDIFLHIVHRQMADEASKREFAAKSLGALALDVCALLPLLRLLAGEECPPIALWPNIIGFLETLCFYRIVEFFDLRDTHSTVSILLGYGIIVIFIANLLTCFYLLMTYHGLCRDCFWRVADWRLYLIMQFPSMHEGYNLYYLGFGLAVTLILKIPTANYKPATLMEYGLMIIIIAIGMCYEVFFLGPKLFSEQVLSAKRIGLFHSRAARIVDEFQRRNPSESKRDIEEVCNIIWSRRRGVTSQPRVLRCLPRYLKLQLQEDVLWPVFTHSPTLRRTSPAYKRWLGEHMRPEHRMPGERLFAGRHCHTHLSYVRAGVVQLLSAEDGQTPVLSASGGTLFGDVSFCLPPLRRQAIVRCLTYCEVILVPRAIILLSLHKFPEDRALILRAARERVQHARRLHACKAPFRGRDRVEDEDLKWIKDRWWQIFHTLTSWKKSSKRNSNKCTLPAERMAHHCAKYIGQLVLCPADRLRVKAIFCRAEFPWLLAEHSAFARAWHAAVSGAALAVLLLYPPALARAHAPDWFFYMRGFIDLIYLADVIISLFTVTSEVRTGSNIKNILLSKFKSGIFILDVIAAVWFEYIVLAWGATQYYEIVQYNRLLKVHKFFDSKFSVWRQEANPLNGAIAKTAAGLALAMYVSAYASYLLPQLVPALKSIDFIFASSVCTTRLEPACKQEEKSSLWIPFWSFLGYTLKLSPTYDILDIILNFVRRFLLYILWTFVHYKLLAMWFLKYRGISEYDHLVMNFREFCARYRLHPDLRRRADRYFACQWRRSRGAALGGAATAREPRALRWLVRARAARRVLAASRCAGAASPALLSDLAEQARFTTVPQGFTLAHFGTQCECVTWIINGELKCEYNNDEGELVSQYERPADALSVSALFAGLPALETYTTATDCEILYITRTDFFNVVRRYPEDWSRFESCIKEMTPLFDELFNTYLQRHHHYEKKIRKTIYHDRKSVFAETKQSDEDDETSPSTSLDFGTYIADPEARFVHAWITLRVAVALVSMFAVGIRLTVDKHSLLILAVLLKCVQLIQFAGFLDYAVDQPHHWRNYVQIAKFQISFFFLSLFFGNYFLHQCLKFHYNFQTNRLQKIALRHDSCWISDVMTMRVTYPKIVAMSLDLAQSAWVQFNITLHSIDIQMVYTWATYFFIILTNWFITTFCQAMLVLNYGGDAMFQHGVNELVRFLKEERVDKHLINDCQNYFNYEWSRAKQVDLNILYERIGPGIMLCQDINAYFFKETFAALNSLLAGDERLARRLAARARLVRLLPRQEALRERALAHGVLLVHRGRVELSRRGRPLDVLTRGALVGQLSGGAPRPVRVSARALGYADILELPAEEFQEALSEESRQILKSSMTYKYDFLRSKKHLIENAEQSVEYIIRGGRVLQLPWWRAPAAARCTRWYARALYAAWLWGSALATALEALQWVLPGQAARDITYALIPIDLYHLIYFLSELFTMELVAVRGACAHRHHGLRKLRQWHFLADALSLLMPALGSLLDTNTLDLFRCLRVHNFINFYYGFCKDFQNKYSPVLLKIVILVLLLHCLACSWIYFACTSLKDKYRSADIAAAPLIIVHFIDFDEWDTIESGQIGCVRASPPFFNGTHSLNWHFVSKRWHGNYLISLLFVVCMFSRSDIATFEIVSSELIYKKIIISLLIEWARLWITSEIMSYFYTSFHELYNFEFKVQDLVIYLKTNGISRSLLEALAKYCRQLWKKVQGKPIPKYARLAPPCLRQDVFAALYAHHLRTPPLLRALPDFFLLQLAVRLTRKVVFPGNYIVQEGDVHACVYFIHEGEVERWCTDAKGESKMASLLTMNGYFGLIPGLFPNACFRYSYYSRTVVDLVCLVLADWQDLLDAYPDIKTKLYYAAERYKKREEPKDTAQAAFPTS